MGKIYRVNYNAYDHIDEYTIGYFSTLDKALECAEKESILEKLEKKEKSYYNNFPMWQGGYLGYNIIDITEITLDLQLM